MLKPLSAGVENAVIRRVTDTAVASKILKKATEPSVKDPNRYVMACIANWEIDKKRHEVASEKMLAKAQARLENMREEKAWDKRNRTAAMKVLLENNSVNSITFAMWIESGLTGCEFSKLHNITKDCLYQRKLRARLEVLDLVFAETAAWMYVFGRQPRDN